MSIAILAERIIFMGNMMDMLVAVGGGGRAVAVAGVETGHALSLPIRLRWLDANGGYERWMRMADTNGGYEWRIRMADTNGGCE
jgi:hypothetical protein